MSFQVIFFCIQDCVAKNPTFFNFSNWTFVPHRGAKATSDSLIKRKYDKYLEVSSLSSLRGLKMRQKHFANYAEGPSNMSCVVGCVEVHRAVGKPSCRFFGSFLGAISTGDTFVNSSILLQKCPEDVVISFARPARQLHDVTLLHLEFQCWDSADRMRF